MSARRKGREAAQRLNIKLSHIVPMMAGCPIGSPIELVSAPNTPSGAGW